MRYNNRRRNAAPTSVDKPKKPGLNARLAATVLLTRVIDDQRSLDGLLDTKHGPQSWHKLEQDDKNLTRAIVTTALRHRGKIEHLLSKCVDRKLPKNARHLLHTLHVAAAQILFLEVPDRAAVDLAVTALRDDQRSTRFANLGNAVLRRLAREFGDNQAPESQDELARLNTAPWFWKRLRKDYGREKTLEIAKAHMLESVIDVTVKSDPESWAEKLGGFHLFGNSVRVPRSGKISDWPGFEDGEWWVQDAAASLPVHLLGEITGSTVADLCAAPGGKTAQLACAGAKVIAVEQSADRSKRLVENLKRLKLDAEIVNEDLFSWQANEPIDAILLDAPCSSTGTVRRHPDIQWTKDSDAISELATLQEKMILRAIEIVKPGGTVLFSNCSIDKAEGEDIVAKLSKENTDLLLNPFSDAETFGLPDIITGQGTLRTLPFHLTHLESMKGQPQLTGLDGFFAARFIKQG